MGTSKYLVRYRRYSCFSDISFGMCLCLMSWVQQVHNAAVVARSLAGCQLECDTEMPTSTRTRAPISYSKQNTWTSESDLSSR